MDVLCVWQEKQENVDEGVSVQQDDMMDSSEDKNTGILESKMF